MHNKIQPQRISTVDTFSCDRRTLESYECKVCTFKTTLKVDLKEHFRIFHEAKNCNSELPRILKCYDCEKCDFQTHSLLIIVHHNKVCNGASDGEKQEKALQDEKTQHNQNKLIETVTWWKCKLCPYKTTVKCRIKTHIALKHGVPEALNWFKCEHCVHGCLSSRAKKNTQITQTSVTPVAEHASLKEDSRPKNILILTPHEIIVQDERHLTIQGWLNNSTNEIEGTGEMSSTPKNTDGDLTYESDNSSRGDYEIPTEEMLDSDIEADTGKIVDESNQKGGDERKTNEINKIKDGTSRSPSENNLKNSVSNEEHEAPDVITFDSAKKNHNNGKRVRDKGHACYLCEKMVANMARHLETKHGKEPRVSKVLAMPKCSKERRDAFAELIRIGDFQHNCNVLASKSGELILVRRPSEKEKQFFKYSDYGPCPKCLGFTLKKNMWHHVRHGCVLKKINGVKYQVEDQRKRKVVSESNALVRGLLDYEFSSDYNENIVYKLRDDDVGRICQNDRTILNFGYLKFQKYGPMQSELTRQSMRQIGRLLIEIQKARNNIKELSDCFTVENFETILVATRTLSATMANGSNSQSKIPSLALKIGHNLTKCLALHRGQALKHGDLIASRNCASLQQLLKSEWTNRMSNCLSTLENEKEIRVADVPESVSSNNKILSCDTSDPMEETRNTVILKRHVEVARSHGIVKKNSWSQAEKEIVLNYFKTEMKQKVLPGKKRCEECISQHAALRRRKWTDLKFCIKNFYTRNEKMPQ